MRAAARPVSRVAPAPAPVRAARPALRRAVAVQAGFAPPSVSETKAAFLKNYPRPIASIYSVVVQELLVQQHFMRYSVNYEYNPIYALGVVSVFDQVLEQVDDSERSAIFNAYIASLGEDAETFRKDAAQLEAVAGSMTSLAPEGDNEVQKALAEVAAKSADAKFNYNRFFAIGLFRLLELTGAKEPAALEALVKAVGVNVEAVNRDLKTYKGVLSKLSVAKELMKDFLEREKRKQAEREAEKAAKAAKEASSETASASA